MAMEALRLIGTERVFVPKIVTKCSLAILVFDNIDRRDETLSGHGTSHRFNGILIQEQQEDSIGVQSYKNKVEEPPPKRTRHRTLHGVPQTDLP